MLVFVVTGISTAQQITLDTSLVYPTQGTIEEFWYWSGGFPVLGEGFDANSTITVFATDPDGTPWRDFIGASDAQGNFSVQISAKKIRSILGEHIITATDGQNTVTAILTVIANERETLNSTATPQQINQTQFAGSGVTIRSTGLEPNALVKVNIFTPNEEGSELEPGTSMFANANGEFEMTVNLFTPSYPIGSELPDITGNWRISVSDFTSQNTSYGQTTFRILPDNPSPTNYCTVEQLPNATGSNGVYPITSFEIEGVGLNESSVNSEIYSEDFTNIIFDLNAGDSYTIKMKGKSGSSFAADTYTLFIDWNQNGILDEDNEVIHEGYLFDSTGEDGKTTSFEITVPENAINGETRLRVLKVNSATEYSMYWPSGACGFYLNNGQVEDYTLNISNGLTLPDCIIDCPSDLVVQTEIGDDFATVDYELNYDCQTTTGLCEVAYPSNDFENWLPNSQFEILANDFDIPQGSTAVVTQIVPNFVRYSYGTDIYIYEDQNGIPGSLITSFTNVQYASQTEIGQCSGGTVYEVVMDLPTPLELTGGKYWIVLNAQGPLVSWESTSDVTTEVAYTTPDNGQTWDPVSDNDGVFKVVYECQIDPTSDAELVLIDGLASGSEFPIGNTTVTHNLVYEGVVIDSCSFTVTVEETLGANDLSQNEFKIYPNPAQNIVNVVAKSNMDKISVYNISGQLILQQAINDVKAQLNIANLSQGTYFLKVESIQNTQTYKLLKM